MKRNTVIILCALVVALAGILFAMSPKKKEGMTTKSVEIVVARYNEDLEWLKDSPFNKYDITVYNKGDNDDFAKPLNVRRVIRLKNVGKCDHTYLHHIVNNYDRLSDVTVFLPGSTDMDYKSKKARRLMDEIEKTDQATFINEVAHKDIKQELYNFTLEEWKTSNQTNQNKNPESKTTPAKIRPFGRWFESNFGNIQVSNITYAGIFSVAKLDILQHPLKYYESLEAQLSTSSNPEVGHYFERAWAAVFHPMSATRIINAYL